MRLLPPMLFLLLSLAFAGPALAVDGVLEVNQTCAVQTGCFAGDTAGYPVTINGSAGRSYRLTSDLIVPDENTDGIRVSTSTLTIDLNGFEIVRSGCEGATTNCAPALGSGAGVERISTSNRGISVKNGSITGMGSYGVLLSGPAEVSGLRVRWSRLDGIAVGAGSTISDNTVYENGGAGISAGAGSTVSGNTAYQNGDTGILGGHGSTVSGNTAYENGSTGIVGTDGSTILGNTAYNNGGDGDLGDGVFGGIGSTVSDNTAYSNADDGIVARTGSTVSGNTALGNGGDGIDASLGTSSAVQSNTVTSNGGYGLRLSTATAYRENVINSNTAGAVTGGFNNGRNTCGAVLCP